MPLSFHIVKGSTAGWEVRAAEPQRTTSTHRTQAEAVRAARRLAIKCGGAEVVVHRADGRVRARGLVSAAALYAAPVAGPVETEELVTQRRRQRWAAVVPGAIDIEQTVFPTAEEARAAVLHASGKQ